MRSTTSFDNLASIESGIDILETKLEEDIANFKQDQRYNNQHKSDLIRDAVRDFDTTVEQLAKDFHHQAETARQNLESVSTTAPTQEAERVPESLMLESDKILWRQSTQTQHQLQELIDLQRETMHKSDIDRMQALEIVTAYELAVENGEEGLQNSLENYGFKRLKVLVSQGNKEAVTAKRRLNDLAGNQIEERKTDQQKMADADLAKLGKISTSFKSKIRLKKKYSKRKF